MPEEQRYGNARAQTVVEQPWRRECVRPFNPGVCRWRPFASSGHYRPTAAEWSIRSMFLNSRGGLRLAKEATGSPYQRSD